MSIFSRIVAGTDGSATADAAVVFAAKLANEHESKLITVHFNELRGDGEAASDILDRARDEACTLIVMGTHSAGTTKAVLRGSTIPVLIVHAIDRAARPGRCFQHLVVGVDDSEPSDAALATVIDLPPEDRRRVQLISVAGPVIVVGGSEYYQAALDELHEDTERVIEAALATARKRGCTFESRVVDGRPAAALVATAEHEKADLIVLGSHGRRGLRRLFIGSVAESVVQSSPIPVLVVRGLQKATVPVAQNARALAPVGA